MDWSNRAQTVSQHMQKITDLYKFGLNWSSRLVENNERKNPCYIELCAFRCLRKASQIEIILVNNHLFL